MPLASAVEILGQRFDVADLLSIAVLVILEGVLSIDNALVLGLLAKRLPRQEQSRALFYGLVGAFVFRIIAVLTASFLLRWTIAKFLGGGYLVYIAVKHLFFESKEEGDTKVELDEHGHPKLVDADTGGPATEEAEELEIRERQPFYMDRETRKRLGLASFWPTVLVIELTDIAFAVDSILAALAFVGSPPPGHDPNAFHPKLWLVVVGGMLGVALMRVAAQVFIKLLDKFPRFEMSAYLLVIVIGLKLLADWGVNSDWSFDNSPWMSKRLGSYKTTFEGIEANRRSAVKNYEGWLEQNWAFPPSKWEAHHGHDTAADAKEQHAEAADHEHKAEGEGNAEAKSLYVPHLLNFHQLTRPESMAFWLAMVVCFLIGFIPKKSPKPQIPLGEQTE
jgi:YkoY family integral membrane protein